MAKQQQKNQSKPTNEKDELVTELATQTDAGQDPDVTGAEGAENQNEDPPKTSSETDEQVTELTAQTDAGQDPDVTGVEGAENQNEDPPKTSSEKMAIVDQFFHGFRDGVTVREDFCKGDLISGSLAINAVDFQWAHWATAEEIAALQIEQDGGDDA